tara:strand:+ start:537 stop:1283 length:747 start_codon:yes stop_codon:yes gene_type:complete
MHYYQKNIADYRKDTCHLTLLEHGIYNMLMDSYYLNEEPIKTQTVNRRLSINSEEEEEALLGVLNDFFVLDNETDLWSHSRIDVEINKYHLKAEVNKKNGKLGGRPKKTQSVISGLPEESEGKAKITLTSNHKPITNNQEPIKSLCPQTDGKMIWKTRINKLYKRRESTQWNDKETRAFNKLTITEEDMELIEAFCDPVKGSKYRRKDIFTLLNNWNGEVDRARDYSSTATVPTATPQHANPADNYKY